MVSISLCSQVKNRIHQFSQTFKHNVSLIKSIDNIEWNIVDCNSNDGISEFMESFFASSSQEIIKKINYYECIDEIKYHIPIFKNIAARLSNNDYVFNLDIDNYIEDHLIKQIHENGLNKGVCCRFGKQGTFGRIGCSRENFKNVGGYDESFLPAAAHEDDFMSRSEKIKYYFEHVDCKKLPVKNSKTDTTKNFSYTMTNKKWTKDGRKLVCCWREMYDINLQKVKYNLDNNIINPNKSHAKGRFLHNFKDVVELTEEF